MDGMSQECKGRQPLPNDMAFRHMVLGTIRNGDRAFKQLRCRNNLKEKMMNTKTEGNTFTKKIGQKVYVVRYHFNEDAKETMQEKINRMSVTEASRMAMY